MNDGKELWVLGTE